MTRSVTTIAVTPDLWAPCMCPGGILESWLLHDGCDVEAGDPVAAVRVEDTRHELAAPAAGRLQVGLKADSIVQPGTVIGSIVAEDQSPPR